jgi:autotransporter-associated beta strand protein
MNAPFRRSLRLAAAAGLLVAASPALRAADLSKADNADNLDLPTSWVGGVVPGAADTAVWDSTVSGANTTVLDANLSWLGLRVTSPGGAVTINSNLTAATLTLGAGGMDLGTASQNLTFNPRVNLSANQTWNVGTGRSLTINGPILGTGRVTKVGPGTLFVANLNEPFAGGFTVAEATVQTGNSGNVSTILGTNTLVLTNGGRVRFQSTGSVTHNTPTLVEAGGGILSFRANSFYGSPPLSGPGRLTLQLDNNVTITPTSFQQWNGRLDAITVGTIGYFRLATGFTNDSMTNAHLTLGAGVQFNRQTASAATVELGALSGTNGSSVNSIALRTGWRNEDSRFDGIFTGGNPLTKVGSGKFTVSGNSTLTGSVTNNGGRIIGVTGGSFSNAANFVINAGGLGVQLASPGGQWVTTNLTFSAGATALDFDFAAFPVSLTTAPLLVLGNLTPNATVTVNLTGGGWGAGSYPLATFTGTLGGAGMAAFTLGTQPSGVTGYLTNDPANTIAYVVTSSRQPVSWAVGNGNWDINTSVNWKDASGSPTTYQEPGGIGDTILLNDSATGASPITITLVQNVQPSGLTISNNTKNYILTGANAVGGGTPLTKTGTGTLTLQNNNTYSGGTVLNGGVLVINDNANLGASSGPVTFNGGTLRFATGSSPTLGTRTVTFAAGGATIDDNGQSTTLTAPLGNNGPGRFTKLGSGNLTLTGTNRYNGTTFLNGGTLTLGNNTYISNSSAIVVAGGATLDASLPGLTLGAAASQILAGTGNILGSVTVPAGTRVSPATNGVVGNLNVGDLTVSGGTLNMDISTSARDEIIVSGTVNFTAGTLALNITGTLTNGTYRLVQAGWITPGSAANLVITGFAQPGQVATLSEATPGQIDLVVSPLGGANITWVGDNALNLWDVNTSFNWTNPTMASLVKYVNGDHVLFNNSGSTAPDVNLTTSVLPGSVTVNASVDYVFSSGSSGKISGSTGLTKSGTGTLTLATDNNNTGPTTITAGTLRVGQGGTTGDLGSGVITNHGALIYNVSADRNAAAITGTGRVENQGGGKLTLTADNTYSGGTTIAFGSTIQVGTGAAAGTLGTGAVTNDGILILNRAGTATLANPISGSGEVRVTGPGTLTLVGANSYAGNTYISNGIVALGAPERLPDAGGWLILDGGATAAGALDLNGFNETISSLSGLTGTVLGRITNSAGGSGTNTLRMNRTATTTFAGLVTENPSGAKTALYLDGPWTTTLIGNSTFSGGITLADGILNVQAGGSGTGQITVSNNTTLNISSTSPSTFVGNNVLVGADALADFTSASLANGFGGSFLSGNTNSVARIGANVSFSSSTLQQFAGFNGTVEIIPGGTLRFSATGLTNNGGPNTRFIVNGLIQTRNGTGGGPGVFLGSLEGNGTIGGPQTPPGNSTWIIGGRNVDSTFSGTVAGDVAGSVNNLVKTGTGKLTLDGTLTTAGTITVSNGTLAIAGSAQLTNSPTINLRSGGTLDMTGAAGGGLTLGTHIAQTLNGGGTLLGNLTVGAGSTVQPGDGIGTLTVSGTAALNGLVRMELNRTNSPATNDLIAAGAYSATGTLIVTNLGPDLVAGDKFKLFSTAITGFSSVILPTNNLANTITYTWNNKLAVDGSIEVLTAGSSVNTNATNITAVFSPGSVTLSWPASHIGWTLQSQTNSRAVGLGTNWVNVAGSSSTNSVTLTVNPTNGAVFFRLVYP